MALFVPTTGGSNGWGSGFDAFAQAFAQAPLNRMKAREAEINAQNIAADNARAEKMLELQYAQEKRQADAELVRLQLLRDADARSAAAAGEALTHAQLHNPQIREGQSLQNRNFGQTYDHNAIVYPIEERKAGTDADIAAQSLATARARDPHDIESARLGSVKLQGDVDAQGQTYRHNENMYPLVERKSLAEADLADVTTNSATDKYNSIPAVRDALTQDVMGIVERGLPEFDVGRSLKGYAPPPKITLPGLNPTMDYPEASPAMDDVQRRQEIMKRVWELTLPPAAAESVPKDWVADTAANVLAGQRDTAPTPGSGPFPDTSMEGRSANIVDAYNKKVHDQIPVSVDETRQYAIAFNQLYANKTQMVAAVDNQTGKLVFSPIVLPTDRPPGLADPGTGQVAPPPPPPPPPDPASVASTQTAVPPVASTQTAVPTVPPVASPPASMYPIPVPQTAVAATASQVPAGVSPIPRASAAPKPPNEFELKAKMFAQRMDTSWDQLSKVIGYDRATKVYRADKKKVKGWWDAIQMRASRGLSEYAGNEFRGGLASDDQQEFMGASEGLLNAVLRFDSGASVLPPEYNRYTMEFLPGPLTSDKEDLNKIIRIEATIEAMKEIGRIAGKNVDEMSDAELKALKASGAIDAAITRNVAKLGGTYTPINYGDPAASGGLTPEDEDLLNQYPEN